MIASHADIPIPFYPRTPRNARGRFPESVGFDDDEGEKTASDDDDNDYPSGYPQSLAGEGSVGHSVFEEQWLNNSPAGAGSGMDVDMVCLSRLVPAKYPLSFRPIHMGHRVLLLVLQPSL